MFRRDSKTGEEIAHRVITPNGNTIITATNAEFWQSVDGAQVEEVRGHTHPNGTGFVVERTA
ncbi:predicted protein [Streptomyces viridosporus ATCC 14672]|uniref:Predicted protein n=1 Tax=Streptomyces viridosporus (strain ATCC 14672 / DSM 40746 / JCM 4963 / KCTC 9882 / NRRL B-12104 / FH 1290) TaxID=566461 RepID=D6A4G1_STRV1|nr:hypothetical protein [Streptomyces viridosporus]EFE65801.1 predicted protein [Streptomyces viridosporus ATCC 14672]